VRSTAPIARKGRFLKGRLGAQLFAKENPQLDDPLRRRGLRAAVSTPEGVRSKKKYARLRTREL